ncbi:MAG: glycerol-3-phosphate 1-O-acyltransferase PlsY [Acidobacteriota bacterium]|nr:glycerol-3-phosphate 1-O-acyltransferase PlsY [Acidobacteriota bacterium]
MPPATVIVVAYLVGSIPFGYLIVRAKQGGDVRKTGSGGTGATNVSRRAGKGAGVITLILDALKGVAAVVIAKLFLGAPVYLERGYIDAQERILVGHAGPPLGNAFWWVAAAAMAVIVGHIFPVWLRFRGGKGVATGVGVFIVLAPIAVALAGLIFVLIVAVTRYVSLGSIVAAATIPLFIVLQSNFIQPVVDLPPLVTAAIAGAALIIFAHRENIRRLIQGTESRFK